MFPLREMASDFQHHGSLLSERPWDEPCVSPLYFMAEIACPNSVKKTLLLWISRD